ncbi:hypothetical protein SAMN04488063_1415 [Halopelagius inordinatus]|uniref:Uncharacterized protein n=1 Tax=Halopelagius inordinatus TaxID=553467 RepID=A0A1I2P2R4_9EURY|nr:hypothetical protein [Halopelagius inordinatus]SFG09913.1 hypothetical protein SAMN04488063_1415 [Halopelagius inordinatus]
MLFLIHSGGAGPRGRTPDTAMRDATLGRGHYACGVLGLGAALLAMFLAYSVLVAVASLVPLLSTTAIAFVGIVTWVVLWLVFDAALIWLNQQAAA